MIVPTLNGWVWNISFYPCSADNRRTVKNIFWYDSSTDLEFVKHTEEYQIVLPEFTIIGSLEEKSIVRKNLDYIWKNKIQVVHQVGDDWRVSLPDALVVNNFLSI
jgi:hypothetical protein